jgi:pimeloyl-ACP methyl ester carboxylesterase
MDPRAIVGAAVDTNAGGVPDDIRADYLACYDGDRFAESAAPSRLEVIDAGHFIWEVVPAEYASIVLDSITG